MTIEQIQYLRGHGNVSRGALIVGNGSVGGGGGPGGTGIINAAVRGWDATMGMHCFHLNLESFAQSFGSNGYASWTQYDIDAYLGAWFPPFGAAPGPNRILRLREVCRFRVTQADANNPISKMFYGIAMEASAGSSTNPGDVPQQAWCGFVTWWTGTTPSNWEAIVTDDAKVTRFSQDLGIGTDAPHILRLDVDPIDGEIRWYIDETLVATYTVTSGFMNVTDSSPNPVIMCATNPGYITGAAVNTIVDSWSEVFSYGASMFSIERP